MRAPFVESPSHGHVQVLSIGNAYEVELDAAIAPAERPPFSAAEERHWSQKSAYWLTEHGFPKVAVCSAAPDAPPELMPARHIVCPARHGASLCADLLADSAAKSEILRLLTPDAPVFLTGYVVTSHLAQVADWLIASGRSLLDWRPAMVPLTQRLANKALAHQELFARDPQLLELRPACALAYSLAELREAIAEVARATPAGQLVVKSAVSSGGEGVFFVDAETMARATDLSSALVARGFARHVAPPFVVEARIPTVASPTVDVLVHADGTASSWGVSAQRLSDGRYYGGFHRPSRARLERIAWYPAVLAAAERVGRAMAAAGYVGFFNVDFVIDPEARPFIVEINPRRSALLDGVGFARFWSEEGFDLEISTAEYVEARAVTTPAAAHALPSLGRHEAGGVVAPILDGSFGSDRHLGLVAVAREGSERMLWAAIDALRGPEHQSRHDMIGVAEL